MVDSWQIILKYFPDLSERQREQMAALGDLYEYWNARINVISRKDISNLYLHHVLHSLAIAKYVSFANGSRILDVGTGGGFPGIPLAVMFPQCEFTLIDSIGKKIKVCEAVAQEIGLDNVTLKHENAKEEKGKYDFVVSRAVMQAQEMWNMVRKHIESGHDSTIGNGLICLKGDTVAQELEGYKGKRKITKISDYFHEDFFETKCILYMPVKG